jgi:hypothetical protein
MTGEQDDLMAFNNTLIEGNYLNRTDEVGTKFIKNMKYLVLKVSLFFFFLFVLMLLFHFGKFFRVYFFIKVFILNYVNTGIKFYKKYKLKKNNKMIKKLGKELL